jgi:hypothetical protein
MKESKGRCPERKFCPVKLPQQNLDCSTGENFCICAAAMRYDLNHDQSAFRWYFYTIVMDQICRHSFICAVKFYGGSAVFKLQFRSNN